MKLRTIAQIERILERYVGETGESEDAVEVLERLTNELETYREEKRMKNDKPNYTTISSKDILNHPNLSLSVSDYLTQPQDITFHAGGQELLRIGSNGTIYYKGQAAGTSQEVYEAVVSLAGELPPSTLQNLRNALEDAKATIAEQRDKLSRIEFAYKTANQAELEQVLYEVYSVKEEGE